MFIDVNSLAFSSSEKISFKVPDLSGWKLKEKIITFLINVNIQYWLMHLLGDSWIGFYNHCAYKYCIKIMAESFYQFFDVIAWHWI